MPERQDVGEDPGKAHQLMVERMGEHRDGEDHVWEGVEKLGVVGEGEPAVEEILALKDAARVDASPHADHQVKRQLLLATAAGHMPENALRHDFTVAGIGSEAVAENGLNAPCKRSLINVPGPKPWWQRDGRRLGSAVAEAGGDATEGLGQLARRANVDACGGGQAVDDTGLSRVKHQFIDPQARNIAAGIEALERIVEIVGEKHRFDVAFFQHTVRPARLA